jgi:hypothetical protein
MSWNKLNKACKGLRRVAFGHARKIFGLVANKSLVLVVRLDPYIWVARRLCLYEVPYSWKELVRT